MATTGSTSVKKVIDKIHHFELAGALVTVASSGELSIFLEMLEIPDNLFWGKAVPIVQRKYPDKRSLHSVNLGETADIEALVVKTMFEYGYIEMERNFDVTALQCKAAHKESNL